MVIFLLAAALTLLFAITGSVGLQYSTWGNESRLSAREVDFSVLSKDIEQYRRETGAYPASIAALGAVVGHEHIKPSDSVAVSYTTTTGLTGALFTYDRAALVTQDLLDAQAESSVFGSNTCGTGTVATASRWCGRERDQWWLAESQQFAPDDMTRQRMRLVKTARKFALYYTAFTSFPNPGASQVTLAAQVGFSGAANSCTGQYNWSGIPLGCDDLFSSSGLDVTYTYTDSKTIELSVPSSYRTQSGTMIALSVPFSLP